MRFVLRKNRSEDIKKVLLEYANKISKKKRIIIRFEDIMPNYKNIENLDIEYPLIPPFAYAHIFYDLFSEEIKYEVLEPELSNEEQKLVDTLKRKIIDIVYFEDYIKLLKTKKEYLLIDLIDKVINEFDLKISIHSVPRIYYYLWRDLIGLEKIEPLLHDPLVEDISCDGYNIPVYVHHKIFGILKTNIILDKAELDHMIIKLAQKTGRFITYSNPLLDATLPDGSRVNATYSSDITTRGPTFTIRKFFTEKLSIIDLIKNNTLSIDIAAYLWWAVENRANIIIAGETASGKTTLLNAIATFIPPNAKIVSIEDTREIQLYHENWIPAVTRSGFDIGDTKIGEISMFDLLKESFRQNPDYVIVGEVRGQEAYVMFQGMASGHAAMSTMHAESLNSIIKRLTTPPINLPPNLIELLDVAVFMVRAKSFGPASRRVRSLYEIGKYVGDKLESSEIFKWLPKDDKFWKKGEHIIIKELEDRYGISIDLENNIEEKKKILEYMVEHNIRDLKAVSNIIKEYYSDKKVLMEKILR